MPDAFKDFVHSTESQKFSIPEELDVNDVNHKKERRYSFEELMNPLERTDSDLNPTPLHKHKLSDYLAYKLDYWLSSRKSQFVTLALSGFVILFTASFFYSFVNGGTHVQEDASTNSSPTSVETITVYQDLRRDQKMPNPLLTVPISRRLSTVKTKYGHHSLKDSIWMAWRFMSHPSAQKEAHSTGQRVIAWGITVLGILFFNVIMGLIVDAIREKMDSLRKGKSKVVENNHTLLLGWTDKSISFIKEICKANQSEHGGVIVVLADADKETLEHIFHSSIKPDELLGSTVVFRSGNPLLAVDLTKASASTARAIVILAQLGDADKSDAAVLRVVLSLRGLSQGLQGHIVVEVRDVDNEPLVRLVGGDYVDTIVSHDIIGRLILMSARQPGLAKVYKSVLGFDGDEFYIKNWPQLTGLRFGDLVERFPKATAIGIEDSNGHITLKPSCNRVIRPKDRILVLAEDDDSYTAVKDFSKVDPGEIPKYCEPPKQLEKILICGWRRDIRDMLKLLDSFVGRGTEVHIVCEQPVDLRDDLLMESGLDVSIFKNMKLIHHFGNTAVRRHMESIPVCSFTSFMILSDESREADVMHSDSHSLASLLLLRDIQRCQKRKIRMTEFSSHMADKISNWEPSRNEKSGCICEVLDPRTQKTISTSRTVSHISDFVQSNEMVSRILAMVAENRAVRSILIELLGDEGASFTVEPAAKYCRVNEKLSFFQLAKRAQTYDYILCGYQEIGSLKDTILNPKDKEQLKLWDNMELVLLTGQPTTIMDKHSIGSIIEIFKENAKHRKGIKTKKDEKLLTTSSKSTTIHVSLYSENTADSSHKTQATSTIESSETVDPCNNSMINVRKGDNDENTLYFHKNKEEDLELVFELTKKESFKQKRHPPNCSTSSSKVIDNVNWKERNNLKNPRFLAAKKSLGDELKLMEEVHFPHKKEFPSLFSNEVTKEIHETIIPKYNDELLSESNPSKTTLGDTSGVTETVDYSTLLEKFTSSSGAVVQPITSIKQEDFMEYHHRKKNVEPYEDFEKYNDMEVKDFAAMDTTIIVNKHTDKEVANLKKKKRSFNPSKIAIDGD